MNIFLDTANIDEIKEAAELGIVDGVTTNPSLIAKEKKDLASTIKQICEIIDGPVSAEVIATDADGMVAEGIKLAAIHSNVVVKVPFTRDGIIATNRLAMDEDIPVNVTLIFSPNQALVACKAGARYISPFVGRLDDIGHDGVSIAMQCQNLIDIYDFDTEVIAASIRHPQHVLACMESGLDIVTIPNSVLKALFNHPLTDIGLERFLKDWEEAQK